MSCNAMPYEDVLMWVVAPPHIAPRPPLIASLATCHSLSLSPNPTKDPGRVRSDPVPDPPGEGGGIVPCRHPSQGGRARSPWTLESLVEESRPHPRPLYRPRLAPPLRWPLIEFGEAWPSLSKITVVRLPLRRASPRARAAGASARARLAKFDRVLPPGRLKALPDGSTRLARRAPAALAAAPAAAALAAAAPASGRYGRRRPLHPRLPSRAPSRRARPTLLVHGTRRQLVTQPRRTGGAVREARAISYF